MNCHMENTKQLASTNVNAAATDKGAAIANYHLKKGQ